MNRKLILESGEIFYGEGFGSEKIIEGEVVFNTSMTGYQEIISAAAVPVTLTAGPSRFQSPEITKTASSPSCCHAAQGRR